MIFVLENAYDRCYELPSRFAFQEAMTGNGPGGQRDRRAFRNSYGKIACNQSPTGDRRVSTVIHHSPCKVDDDYEAVLEDAMDLR